MLVKVFNPGRVAAVFDAEGRVIGAGEWAYVADDDPVATNAISRGVLIVTGSTTEGSS